jgi:tRNA pseudouridine38-40 synthase
VRVKAIVAYDGTDYSGFQRQSNAESIQAALETALAKLVGEAVRVLGSGRTDAGVHAAGQVVAFDVSWRHELASLQRAMNALLPAAIAVLSVEAAAANFDPRRHAHSRWYRYSIYNAPARNPLSNRYSLHVPQALDVTAMQAAAASLLGWHDFSAFGSPPQGSNAVREVLRAEWQQADTCLTFDIVANAFLFRMVRMLVGTMLRVGQGALTPQRFAEILHTQDRSAAGPAAGARGLTLMAVHYNALTESGT